YNDPHKKGGTRQFKGVFMSTLETVLVTGSAGRVGRAVVAELKARGLPVRGFDRVPTPGADESIVGDITDGQTLLRAAQGAGTLIHLAATPDDDDFLTQLLPNNIVGVYHTLEAARLAGVKRMILASSGQVNWGQRSTGPWPVRVEDPISPRYWYAAAKVFLEAAGRAYADAHGMSVIVARLGWCPRTPEQVQEMKSLDWAPDVYFSPADAGRFFACAVQAPADLRFAVVFAASKPVRKQLIDREPARRLPGYEPRDTWPEGIERGSGRS
ncbi:MAG TPA: NAD(P)-dependent oxidoreductase, partial [Gemmataceae bacterium]|nr:NAD(P)-dependent oxidoreductase [Gemmataceae bacterium]